TLGTGLLKPNVATMVGNLYDKDDERRDAGFSIYVFGINLGSFVSPILVGWFQVNVNFHVAFSLAAIGMFIGLVQYTVDGRKHLSNVSRKAPSPLQPEEMKSLGWKLGLILIAIILILFTLDRKITRLNSSHVSISYAVFCLKKKTNCCCYL